MSEGFMSYYAAEMWHALTMWWPDPRALEEAVRLIDEAGEESAYQQAYARAFDSSLPVAERYFCKKVLFALSQELWRRRLVM